MNNFPLRPLGKIMQALEDAGHPVTHAYDDLVFVDHMPFLLRFDAENAQQLYFYGHKDWDSSENNGFFQTASSALKSISCELIKQGRFELAENTKEEESIDITFYDEAEG